MSAPRPHDLSEWDAYFSPIHREISDLTSDLGPDTLTSTGQRVNRRRLAPEIRARDATAQTPTLGSRNEPTTRDNGIRNLPRLRRSDRSSLQSGQSLYDIGAFLLGRAPRAGSREWMPELRSSGLLDRPAIADVQAITGLDQEATYPHVEHLGAPREDPRLLYYGQLEARQEPRGPYSGRSEGPYWGTFRGDLVRFEYRGQQYPQSESQRTFFEYDKIVKTILNDLAQAVESFSQLQLRLHRDWLDSVELVHDVYSANSQAAKREIRRPMRSWYEWGERREFFRRMVVVMVRNFRWAYSLFCECYEFLGP
ncbi:MAG: hypothetical protein M1814_000109 [Vezdaea aestivalis]|nr:MAG: hypothetical protein M1814_000109 [Vezdaea aestivalis]